jgi:hypothetical protein
MLRSIAGIVGIQALARLPVDSRRADLRANFNTAGFISATRAPHWPGMTWN